MKYTSKYTFPCTLTMTSKPGLNETKVAIAISNDDIETSARYLATNIQIELAKNMTSLLI
jgi:hypothetical protein